MMTSTDLTAAKRFMEELCGRKTAAVLCAVSGGLDSMCLLHLLSTWGQGLTVTAAHFNHQLRGADSDRDEAFVRDWCAMQGIPFVCGRADVQALAAEEGLSLEEAARKARYTFLEEQRTALSCDWILTAHHADDNAETMLLNLIRGTGAKGLSGIPAVRGCIARPLLRETRKDLAAYAAENDIPHVEDATNEEDLFARNVLRHRVLPVLRELNPKAVEHMTAAADLLAQDDAALEGMARQLLQEACCEENDALRLDAELCLAAEAAVQSRAVHEALARMAGHRKDLSAAHVEAVCGLLRGAERREASLPYGLTAWREPSALIICRSAQAPQEAAIAVGETVSFGSWRVTLSRQSGDYALSLPQDAETRVTAWQREDRMTLPGSRGPRSLKRLCADAGMTPAARDLLPVLRVNGRAAAIPGIGMDLNFAPANLESAVFVTFHQETEES